MAGLFSPEGIVVAVVILLLFGAKRLPDSARALGRSMRIIKAETKALHEDTPTTVSAVQQPAAAPQPLGSPVADAQYDPYTGQKLQPAPVRYDPYTGQPLRDGTTA